MPILTPEILEKKIEDFYSPEAKNRREEDFLRWIMFNGDIKTIVRQRILREFKKDATIEELIHRLTPINVLQKIITKLSQVYNEAPIRRAADKK